MPKIKPTIEEKLNYIKICEHIIDSKEDNINSIILKIKNNKYLTDKELEKLTNEKDFKEYINNLKLDD